jgi:hypothetical protein
VKLGVLGQIGGNGYNARYLAVKLINPNTAIGNRLIVDQPFERGEIYEMVKLNKNILRYKNKFLYIKYTHL